MRTNTAWIRLARTTVVALGIAGVAAMGACATPPAPPTTTVAPPAWLEPGCYDVPAEFGNVDLEYSGPVDVLDNAHLWSSTGGTCDGGFDFPYTIVRADTLAVGTSKCLSLGKIYPNNLAPAGLPADAWGCNVAVPVDGFEGCIANATGSASVQLVGPVNTLDNTVASTTSADCSDVESYTMVEGTTWPQILDACTALGKGSPDGAPVVLGQILPANLRLCGN
jgi:hypothetical protein